MEKDAKEALQVTKEITVKFIEAGKLSPANFHQIFPALYATVYQTITQPSTTFPSTLTSSEGA